MTITTTQKLIKIGTSKGVTIPAKLLKELQVQPGDELEVTIRTKMPRAEDADVLRTANNLLDRYKEDFHNLAGR